MKPIEENVIVEKSKDFSVRRTRPCRFLCDEKKERNISKTPLPLDEKTFG
ncbi:MAG: hypothetical protein MR681_06890 [Prevotella sp.]|nr:hypothetical protein [Prevotella sp.]